MTPALAKFIEKWEDEVCRTQITTDKGKQRVHELRVLIAAAKGDPIALHNALKEMTE